LAKDLSQLEKSGYSEDEPSSERIQELESAIKRFKDILEEKIQAAGGLATAYKLLGIEYQRMGMHKLALEALENAIEIEPANEILLYMAGTNASAWAASAPSEELAAPLYNKSRRYFEQALSINPFYYEALFSAAVLLSFQYDENEAALELADRAIEARRDYTRAYFLKARILSSLGRLQEAADLYGQISQMKITTEQKKEALQNQRTILDRLYE
jgi:tetratricopeptide (TPR) repeat protein